MRVYMRPLLPVVMLVIGLGVSGCESSDILDKMQDFNPLGVGKKSLPGSRRALFPEGVPGVQQGVPPDLMRGAAQAEPEPTPEPKIAEPKPRTRRARTVAAPPVERPPKPPRRRAAPPPDEPPPDAVWPPPPRPQAQPAAAPPPRAAAPPPARPGAPTPPPDLFTQPAPSQAPQYQWPDEKR